MTADLRLHRHLASWLGQWPAADGRLAVVGSLARTSPGWDGHVYPALGVAPYHGGGVLSVPPDAVEPARALADGSLDRLVVALPEAVGRPGLTGYRAIFRWSVSPAPLPDAGRWEPADDPTLPEWLRVFGGEVLIARDRSTGDYLAGIGLKRHDAYGSELAVGTVPAARGRGLARRLVAQAARRILDEGGVPTYQHAAANVPSARVAEAAGFPDRGWTSFGLSERPG